MKRIAIFASGEGTNAENLIQHFKNSPLAQIALIVTNRCKAGVLDRAERLQVPTAYISKNEMRDAYIVLPLLEKYKVDLVVLAGYLLRIPPYMLKRYPNKIVNIHPALLPKYGGEGMYGQHVHESVIANKETESGITIHLIDEHYDKGKIILQKTCPVLPDDTPETLAKRVHELEYRYFPIAIEELCKK